MPRTTTANLRSRLRSLMYDPAGDGQRFSEAELEAALDQNRAEVRYLELTLLEKRNPGGSLDKTSFRALCGDWEEGGELTDGSYEALTAETADDTQGQWDFAEAPVEPVYLTGQAFNLYGAAVRLLREWAASLKLDHDLSASGKSLSFSQQFQMLMQLADKYEVEARRWPGLGLPAVNANSGAIGTGRLDDSAQWNPCALGIWS